ncbi:acyl carrier protein [Streptomyces sp. NPDC020845]|uniref:acyl carrier protein n=1 Tax=Streptomyces sp. NPDC020845 TaxID=3365096 RepID=UPI0037879FE7
MTNPTADRQLTAEGVAAELKQFLRERTKTNWESDTDLFASGSISSMFAMELVVHVEQTFGTAIAGPDLKIDNFRTVNAMTALVLRLAQTDDAA